MSFAHRLAHERTFKGWTPEQLAQASGVSAFQIGRIEQSRVEASAEAMERLATALGVDMKAAPSQAQAPAPLAEPTRPAAPAPTAPPAAQPVLLHLPPALQQQLEAAAMAHGRSLHGEVLARLEASLAGAVWKPHPLRFPQQRRLRLRLPHPLPRSRCRKPIWRTSPGWWRSVCGHCRTLPASDFLRRVTPRRRRGGLTRLSCRAGRVAVVTAQKLQVMAQNLL